MNEPTKESSARLRAAGSERTWRSRQRAAWLLVGLTLISYVPILQAGFVWDDTADVVANPYLADLRGLTTMWFTIGATRTYYPLSYTTFWLEHHLWGASPLGYHLVNLALHTTVVLLLWRLLSRLQHPSAWLAAAVFAVHPVCVESVAWVAELKNVQSATLYLLSLLAYFRFTPSRPGGESPRWGYLTASLVCFAGALLSKPAAVFLPIVVLLLLWWRRYRLERADSIAIAAMLAMSAAFGLLTMFVEEHYSGASGATWQMPMGTRSLVAARAAWFYVGKLLWPSPLLGIYPRWDVTSPGVGHYVPVAALLVTVFALWHLRSRIGRGPIVAATSFILLIAPASGLFAVAYHLYSFVADHFQYHAAPVLIALLAAGARNIRTDTARRTVVVAALLVLGLLTTQHVQAFRHEKTRCIQTLQHNPAAWLAWNNLGVALNGEGKHADAVAQYRRALQVRPDYPEALNNMGVALAADGQVLQAIECYRNALRLWPTYALAHNNLGTALASAGDLEGAVREYREAVRNKPGDQQAIANLAKLLATMGRTREATTERRDLSKDQVGDAASHNDLGVTLAAAGRTEEAIAEYRRAIAIDPARPEFHVNLATAFIAQGDQDGAIRECLESLRLKPDASAAENALGLALAHKGHLPEAKDHFRKAIQLAPGYSEAWNNIGTAHAALGEMSEAIAAYREAIRDQVSFADAHKNLGQALVSQGRIEEGLAELRHAVEIAPNRSELHDVFGVCLAASGKIEEAVVHFERAVALQPDDPVARDHLARARLALRQ